MRRATELVAAVLALAMLGAACTNDNATNATSTSAGAGSTTTTAASGATTTAGGGAVELRWRTRPANQAESDIYQQISNEIDEADDGFTVTYESSDDEDSAYVDKLRTELADGTAPDVFWVPATDVAEFVAKGLVLDLRPLATATPGYADDQFYGEPMYHLTYDPKTGETGGPLWGLPRDVSTFAIYLNLDLLAKSGAADPRELAKNGQWTWDTLKEVAGKVAGAGGANKGWGMDAWWASYGMFMNAAGGGFFNENRTACALDAPASVKGLEFAKSLYDGTLSVPYGDDATAPFAAGTVGMLLDGRWATPAAREALGFAWDVVAAPQGPAGSGNWLFWGAYMVNAKTKVPDGAWTLVQALTSAEVQNRISSLGANIPSRKGDDSIQSFLASKPPENNQAFVDGLTKSPTPEGPLWTGSWPAFERAMSASVAAVMTGAKSIDDYAATICNDTSVAFVG